MYPRNLAQGWEEGGVKSMPSDELRGPFALVSERIDREVSLPDVPGVYALGRMVNPFVVAYVGRSDDDLNGRLKDHIKAYPVFEFEYCSSAKEAYLWECQLYHEYYPPDDKNHPDMPDGIYLKCSVCGHPEND